MELVHYLLGAFEEGRKVLPHQAVHANHILQTIKFLDRKMSLQKCDLHNGSSFRHYTRYTYDLHMGGSCKL